jgi:hypothetical protein
MLFAFTLALACPLLSVLALVLCGSVLAPLAGPLKVTTPPSSG